MMLTPIIDKQAIRALLGSTSSGKDNKGPCNFLDTLINLTRMTLTRRLIQCLKNNMTYNNQEYQMFIYL